MRILKIYIWGVLTKCIQKKKNTGKTKQQQKRNQKNQQCPMNEAGELRKLYGSGSVWTTNGSRSGLRPEEWWCGFSSYMFPQTLTSANDNIIGRWTSWLHSAWKLLDSCVTTHLICKVKVDLSLPILFLNSLHFHSSRAMCL